MRRRFCEVPHGRDTHWDSECGLARHCRSQTTRARPCRNAANCWTAEHGYRCLVHQLKLDPNAPFAWLRQKPLS
jgi:hypothetical protein